jgi:hypothetical protein
LRQVVPPPHCPQSIHRLSAGTAIFTTRLNRRPSSDPRQNGSINFLFGARFYLHFLKPALEAGFLVRYRLQPIETNSYEVHCQIITGSMSGWFYQPTYILLPHKLKGIEALSGQACRVFVALLLMKSLIKQLFFSYYFDICRDIFMPDAIMFTLKSHPDNQLLFSFASSGRHGSAKEQWPNAILASVPDRQIQRLPVIDTFLSTQFYPGRHYHPR